MAYFDKLNTFDKQGREILEYDGYQIAKDTYTNGNILYSMPCRALGSVAYMVNGQPKDESKILAILVNAYRDLL